MLISPSNAASQMSLSAALTAEEQRLCAAHVARAEQRRRLARALQRIATSPLHALPFLQPGRLVRVTEFRDDDAVKDAADDTDKDAADEGDVEWGWGVVVNFQKRARDRDGAGDAATPDYLVDVLLRCAPRTVSGAVPRPWQRGTFPCSLVSRRAESCLSGAEKPEMLVIPVTLTAISAMSSVRIYLPKVRSPCCAPILLPSQPSCAACSACLRT